ncbi:GntR family transcriptional regulator [Halomonas icarae]|uniref:FCD domain-containing protein n=1 Tax=Halomonas icarae TaxID=2691040 RepID=A0A7X5ANC0_9GAMM|nr:GntR family transcriptional regulator [Halomonas icarae]MDR5903436.1 GntR family transcriptional regulator [Halomonas icarae]NAW14310.1 FCD domain-containing protein [Halomonas icarae]
MLKSTSGNEIAWLQERLRLGMSGGRFPAGSWLRQDTLAEQYGVSRFVVRGALERLAEMGSIEHVPNRGYRVRHWSRREREELTEARLVIEQAMVPLMMARKTPAGVAMVRRAMVGFEKAVREQDGEAMALANHGFHRALADLAGNAALARQVNWLREQGLRGAGPGWPRVAGVERSLREHRDMLSALEADDPMALQGVIHQHLTAWQERPRGAGEEGGNQVTDTTTT